MFFASRTHGFTISSALGILSLYGNHAVVMGRTFYVLVFLLTVELANESIMQIHIRTMLSVWPHQTKNSLSSPSAPHTPGRLGWHKYF